MSRKKVKLLALLLLGILVGGMGAYASIPGPEKGAVKPLVAPGEKDTYYAFFSGGKGGDIRVFGVPSMRLIKQIPVFNPAAQYSYARETDENRSFLDNSGGYRWGNTLFPVLSKTGGDYDGKDIFVQDEVHARVARIELDNFETAKMEKVPNMKTAQALAVDPETKYLLVGGQAEQAKGDNTGIVSFVDPEHLKAGFQVLGPETAMLDGGKDGTRFFGAVAKIPGKNSGGVAVFNIKAIEQAISDKKSQEAAGIPVLDSAKVSGLVNYIPVKGQVTEVSVTPDGKYIVAGGQGTKATVIDSASLEVAAQLNLGQDPRYTAFDGNGSAYTAIYGDNKVVKWDIDKAIDSKGQGKDYIRHELKVHEKPVFLDMGDGRTNKPTGQWLVVYNQGGAKDFLDVKWNVQNAQLVDISEDAMKLVMDSPVEPELTDGVLALATKFQPRDVFTPGKEAVLEGKSHVERKGKDVHVYMTAKRTEYGIEELHVKKGDHVYMHVTNIERTKDIIHGFTINEYNVNLSIAPGKTATADFIADRPGVYWYYCTIFCSALHMEMTGRMIVEP